MGIEALVPVVLAFGIGVFIWLVVRSFSANSRPFALPTLLASLVSAIAFVGRLKPDPGFYWSSFIACFSVGAIVFGLHAHAIKWLVSRRDKRVAPP
jgi:hypothetical protein